MAAYTFSEAPATPEAFLALLAAAPATVNRAALAALGAELAALFAPPDLPARGAGEGSKEAAPQGAEPAAPCPEPGPASDDTVAPPDNSGDDEDRKDALPLPTVFCFEQDAWGNPLLWFRLPDPDRLPCAAKCLAAYQARLCTVTARNLDVYECTVPCLLYHFDVAGTSLTVSVELTDPPCVPTITPWFRNADWNEREFAELYAIRLSGRPEPERLFLDPEIDAGIMNEVIPLSIMMNGACTTDMWERLLKCNAPDARPGQGGKA